MKNEYNWAANRLKLGQAIEALEKRKLIDKSVEINEETVKEEYVKRAGKVIEDKTPKVESESQADGGDEDRPRARRSK